MQMSGNGNLNKEFISLYFCDALRDCGYLAPAANIEFLAQEHQPVCDNREKLWHSPVPHEYFKRSSFSQMR